MRSRSVERRIIGFGLIVGSIAAALILSSKAEAGSPKEEPVPPSVPAAVSQQGQAQGQLQGQLQGQQQGQHVAVDASLVGGDNAATATSGDSVSGAQAGSVNNISTEYAAQVPALIMGTVIPVDCGFGGQAGGANTHGAGFLGASWTTDRCYTLKVANAWAAMGEYEYACEMLMDVSRRALKRRGIIGVDCTVIGARLRGWHAMPAPVVTKSDVAANPPQAKYVTPQEMRDYVDRAFKTSMSK